MEIYWITFFVTFITIPIILILIKKLILKKCSKRHEYSDEDFKHFRLMVFKFTIFYWFCDLFWMSIFLNVLILKFILGIIIMIIIFSDTCLSFLNYKKIFPFDKFFLIQGFCVGIGLSIYLIFLINDTNLQDIVSSIVAALYGGLLTLVGVAWTFKKTDDDKKKDEIKKIKPVFGFYNLDSNVNSKGFKYKLVSENKNSNLYNSSCLFVIENSNKSCIKINKIMHDNTVEKLKGNNVILPNRECLIDISFKNNSLNLVISDELDNEYLYYIDLEKVNVEDKNEINTYKVTEIKELQKEIADILKKYDNAIINNKKNNQGD